jgi:hypothetical protein
VLAGKTLHNHRIEKYKSLTIDCDKPLLDSIQQALEADKEAAIQVREVVSNGRITSAYYQLPDGENNLHRYILFKVAKKAAATLIYIETKSDTLIGQVFVKQ